jgi:hypothetical protein
MRRRATRPSSTVDVNSAVGDGLIDASKPEALIYEPVDGKMKLVGLTMTLLRFSKGRRFHL